MHTRKATINLLQQQRGDRPSGRPLGLNKDWDSGPVAVEAGRHYWLEAWIGVLSVGISKRFFQSKKDHQDSKYPPISVRLPLIPSSSAAVFQFTSIILNFTRCLLYFTWLTYSLRPTSHRPIQLHSAGTAERRRRRPTTKRFMHFIVIEKVTFQACCGDHQPIRLTESRGASRFAKHTNPCIRRRRWRRLYKKAPPFHNLRKISS